MRLPKRFKAHSHIIKTQYKKKLGTKKESLWGHADYEKDIITIDKSLKGRTKLHTYCHEVIHIWLGFLNHPCNEDEALVDLLGGLLAQFLETREYGEPRKRIQRRSKKRIK